MKVLYGFITLILITGCQDRKRVDNTLFEEYYNGGALKSQTVSIGKDRSRKMVYHENGNIKTISYYKDSLLHGEQVWFYENGALEQKVIYVNDKRQDHAYFFYPNGRMKHSRILKDDIEVMFGADYWDDSLNLIKSSLHFNDSGHIYYKKNFDANGHFISEEGHRN